MYDGWMDILRLLRRFRNALTYSTVARRGMRTLRKLRLLPPGLFQFARFFDRRQLRRLATATARARRIRGRLCRRGRDRGHRHHSCGRHGFEGGRGFGLDRWREDLPPLFDEPFEDQPDNGATVWGPAVCGGS